MRALDLPAQAYFQIGDAFVGPQTGVRLTNPGGGGGSYTEIPLGVGGGYTFGGILDVKAQLRTEHVNSSPSPWGFGGGLGVPFFSTDTCAAQRAQRQAIYDAGQDSLRPTGVVAAVAQLDGSGTIHSNEEEMW